MTPETRLKLKNLYTAHLEADSEARKGCNQWLASFKDELGMLTASPGLSAAWYDDPAGMGVPMPPLPVGARWLKGVEVSSSYARACVGFAYNAPTREGAAVWLGRADVVLTGFPCDQRMTPEGFAILLEEILLVAFGAPNSCPLKPQLKKP